MAAAPPLSVGERFYSEDRHKPAAYIVGACDSLWIELRAEPVMRSAAMAAAARIDWKALARGWPVRFTDDEGDCPEPTENGPPARSS
jgi:hypothetical protein